MRDNPNFPLLVVFVIYDPETDAYMTRVSCANGYCTYWSKDVQRAKHYRDKRRAINAAMMAIEHEVSGKLEVRMLGD